MSDQLDDTRTPDPLRSVTVWWLPDCGYTHVADNPIMITPHCPDGHHPVAARGAPDTASLPRCEHGAIRQPCVPCAEYVRLTEADQLRRSDVEAMLRTHRPLLNGGDGTLECSCGEFDGSERLSEHLLSAAAALHVTDTPKEETPDDD